MKLYAVAALAAVTSASAQTVVDNSAKNISEAMLTAAKAVVTSELRDPVSAQLKGVRLIHTSERRPEVICGYINAKNGFGGYVGFKPFWYDVKANKGAILHLAKDDLSYPLLRLPFEWSGCATAMNE